MTYLHVRTSTYKHRVAKIGLAHLSMAIGAVSSVAHSAQFLRWQFGFTVFGYFLIYSSASVLGFFLINELLHGLGVYNYKMCLDQQLRNADEKKDRWTSAIVMNGYKGNRTKQFTLTITAILSKLTSSFVHNNVFILMTIVSQSTFLNSWGIKPSILHFLFLGGVVFGIIISLSTKIKTMYPTVLILQCISLTVAAICWGSRSYQTAAIFFWIFFLVGSIGVFLPDVAIMEVSNPKFCELNLFVGFFVEQIPIVVSIYFVREELFKVIYDTEVLWTNVGICIGVSVVLVILYFSLYPNSHGLKVLQVQRMILFNRLEFATPAVPVPTTVHHNMVPQHQVPMHGVAMMSFPPPPPGPAQLQPNFHVTPPQAQYPGQQQQQSMYPVQQGMYVMPGQFPYYMPTAQPSNAMGSTGQYQFVPTQGPSSALFSTNEKGADAFPSAPALTPVTETEQVLFHQRQHQELPPAYEGLNKH